MGSTDGTREILQRLSAEKPIKVILQPRNGGKGAALRRGFQDVTGDLVVIQDADLEYSPEELPDLIALICQGRADVVYGSRFLGRHRVFLFTHYAGNRLLTFLTNVLYNTMLTDMETCYKVMRTEVLRSFKVESNGFGIEPELTAKIFQTRLPRVRGAHHVRRAWLRGRQEDHVARRHRRALGAAQVPVQGVNEFQRLLKYARPYRGRFVIALVAMVVYAAGTAGLAYVLKPILNGLVKGTEDIRQIAELILLAYLAKGVGGYISDYLMADIGQRVVRDLRNLLFRHTLEQSAAFFSRRTTGQLVSRITNDVNQVQNVVAETVADLIRESLSVVGFLIVMFSIDWRLALVFLTAAPLIVYPLVRLGQRVRRVTRSGQEQLAEVTHIATESLAGHRIVKAFGAESREAERFGRATQLLYRTNMRITGALSALPPIMEAPGRRRGSGGDLVWLWSVFRPSCSTPVKFCAFITAGFMMYQPIKKLSRVNASIQQAIAAAHRIFEMLDTAQRGPGQARCAAARATPRVSRVPRRGGSPTMTSRTDSSCGMCRFRLGRAGCGHRRPQRPGKTTLVNLIPRFLRRDRGSRPGGCVDVRAVALKSLRAQTALVTQETVLFDDTVAANIAYGAPTAARAHVEAAARAAHAEEFIVQLPGTL
jgi:subfamily B ATP-binding cassette protein MsbA